MKKSKLKYRLREYRGETVINRDLDVQALYQHVVRKHWQAIAGQPYQAKVVDVEINLAKPDKQPEQWAPVRLLFVRGTARTDKTQASKKDWAVFLCTDTALTATQILELYAMRWAIEVYFKEANKLWQVFRAVLSGALDELTAVLGDAVTALVLETIDAHIHCWFTQVLQLDPKTLRLEAL